MADVPFAHEVVLSVPPESETAPPLVAIAEVALTQIPPPRDVAASVSDQRVTAPPLVVTLLLTMMSVAALTVNAFPDPVTAWLGPRVTEPAVDSSVIGPELLQELGTASDLLTFMKTPPPADSVDKFEKMSPLVELFEVMVIEPVPVAVRLLLAVAK